MKRLLKGLYARIPFKKQLFSALKFFWIPPHSVYRHLYFTGTFNVKVEDNISFRLRHYAMEIENDIFWNGLTKGWEKLSMRLWIKLCRQSNIIIDIGANTGIYALTAKALKPDAKVYAFEPLKQMYLKLLQNNDINRFDIVCVEKALSDKSGKTVIYETGAEHIAAASLNSEVRAYGSLERETEIIATTLDDFIEEERLEKIDLVKVDVETYEPQVLEGFKKYLPLYKPAFLIEVLTDEAGDKLQYLLSGMGYIYFNIDDKNERIHRVSKITKSDYFNYLLCSEDTARYLKLSVPGSRSLSEV